MNYLLIVLLQFGGEGGGTFGLFMPMIAIIAIMYMLIFRPQMKKQKKHQAMINAIKKGDKIVTSGGIHGTVAGIKDKDNTLIVKIDDKVKIEVGRSFISKVAE